MKKAALFIFFILFMISLNAQESETVKISSKYGDFLYIGTDNILTVSYNDIKTKDLMFTISHGNMKRTADGKIYVNVRNKGTATIKVFYKNKQVGVKEFKCYGIPSPATAVKVGEKTYRYGEIYKAELLKAEKLIADMGPNFDSPFTITKFRLSAYVAESDVSETSNSESFTSEQKEILSKVKKGSKIYFDDVSCVGPDGTKRFLSTLILTVK